MSMRSWIMQPGTMITHYESVKYAALTVLGAASLTVAVMAMLYTTAADALVQPQLKFGDWDDRIMLGPVRSIFANPKFLSQECQTPIRNDLDADRDVGGLTCLQIAYAAQGYHNYQRYLGNWDALASSGNGTSDLASRPEGFALINENTTVSAKWVERVDTHNVSMQYGRIVNNVSLAMPHPGVSSAAQDSRNDIIQPDELSGLGNYAVRASVPSPVMHVLCANMDRSELEPLVWEAWQNKSNPPEDSDFEIWQKSINWTVFNANPNKTVVDDLFGWNLKSSADGTPTVPQVPPIFMKYPIQYNTILNQSQFLYGRDAVYLLGTSMPGTLDSPPSNYSLCQIKVSMSANCSTEFIATGNGADLNANCEDPDDKMRYINS
ncbi:hypothetical protein LTS18_012230, partial [Coniosporium uncinatum]